MARRGDSSATRGERGFILLLVLWVTLILAVLATGFMTSTRSHIQLATAVVEGAKAEAMADAGVSIAIVELVSSIQDPKRKERIHTDGSPYSCTLEGQGIVTLVVQDEGGRININLATDRLLVALFAGLGTDREAAQRAADLVIDYRDGDNDRRPGGAEKAEYEAAGRAEGPKNAPFDTSAELNQVLGIDRALVAAALPFVTVHSSVKGLDPDVTSPALAAIVARGAMALGAPEPFGTSNLELIPKDMVARSRRKELRIISIARTTAGAFFTRETVVDLIAAGNGVPTFKTWMSGSTIALPPEPAAPPRC